MAPGSAVSGSCDLNKEKKASAAAGPSGASEGEDRSKAPRETIEHAFCPKCRQNVVGMRTETGELVCPRCDQVLDKPH